jgi:hypothetical protein
MFHQDSYIKTFMIAKGLPQEIIDMIFSYIYPERKRNLLKYVENRKNIWEIPSDRLLELCSERGGMQLAYFDVDTIFPLFRVYREKRIEHYSAFDETEDIEEDIQENFKINRCFCLLCFSVKFPCVNCCENKKLLENWDISDEPYFVHYHY